MKLFSRWYRSKASVSADAEEEEPDHPLVSSRRRRRQLQRGAKKMSRDSATARWRPGLEAIMEDGAGVRIVEGKAAKTTEKKSKKVKFPRINAQYDGDCYFSRNSPMPMTMPMFSATPYMF